MESPAKGIAEIGPFRRLVINTLVTWPMLGLYMWINHHQPIPSHIVTMPTWVPFVPMFLPVYLALITATWLLPVPISDPALFRACLRANVCAFLLVTPWWILTPTLLSRPPLAEGPWGELFQWIWAIDQPYNVMPCGHGIGPVVASWFLARERPAWRWPLLVVLLATLPSIALVWQHRPIDILLGTVAAAMGIAFGEWFGRKENRCNGS
jgi:hypothetical protein